jgi:hypothetical protein
MSSGSDQAKDKLADAETIVQGIAEGTMQQFEHREQPNRRRGT